MKVALIQAPLSYMGLFTPPLALASLSAYLRRRGHEVLVLDLNIELYKRRTKKYADMWHAAAPTGVQNSSGTPAEFAEDNKDYLQEQADRILASGAKVVGFSIYSTSTAISLYLAKLLKRKNKKIIIVFGGIEASRNATDEALFGDENVDFFVQGEGELTLTDIVENKMAGEFCEGALVRKNGKLTDCGDRDLIKELDSLPIPDFSDYDLNDYAGPRIPITFSRGCCNNCVFCVERSYWRRFRSRTAGQIYRELVFQMGKYPAERHFLFPDLLVNGNVKELEKLADLIIRNELKIFWFGQAAIRKEMTFELLLKLKRSGCIMLSYGLETASLPLMLKSGKVLAKGSDPAKIFRDGHRAGLRNMVNLMFGLPGETEEDFSETLEFVKKNARYIDCINPSPNFCTLSRNTYAHQHPAEFNIRLDPEGYWESKDGSNNYLVRLNRFEELCRLASDLKLMSFYPAREILNRNELIGKYHFHAGNIKEAARYLLRAIKKEGLEISILQRLEPACEKAGLQGLYKAWLREALNWKKTHKNFRNLAVQRFKRDQTENMELFKKRMSA